MPPRDNPPSFLPSTVYTPSSNLPGMVDVDDIEMAVTERRLEAEEQARQQISLEADEFLLDLSSSDESSTSTNYDEFLPPDGFITVGSQLIPTSEWDSMSQQQRDALVAYHVEWEQQQYNMFYEDIAEDDMSV